MTASHTLPLVSVVVPVYNVAKDCVMSIHLSQSIAPDRGSIGFYSKVRTGLPSQ